MNLGSDGRRLHLAPGVGASGTAHLSNPRGMAWWFSALAGSPVIRRNALPALPWPHPQFGPAEVRRRGG